MDNKNLHPDEYKIKLLHEQFERDYQILADYAEMMGRPLFSVKLNEAEELAMYLDPVTRVEMLEAKGRKYGWSIMSRWKAKMDAKLQKYQKEMMDVLGVDVNG